MILEQAILHIKSGQSEEFQTAFKKAQKIIASVDGYMNHDLLKCIEQKDTYLLSVQWKTIESHEQEFRESEAY